MALTATRSVPSPKAPASAARTTCWLRSANLGARGLPLRVAGLTRPPGAQIPETGRLWHRLEDTTESLFHHCSWALGAVRLVVRHGDFASAAVLPIAMARSLARWIFTPLALSVTGNSSMKKMRAGTL